MRLIAIVLICLASAASAQDRRPSHCIAIADATPGAAYLQHASFRDPVAEDTVRLHYIGHASFLIQAPGGLSAVTDFTGFIGTADFLPDAVTMNHAHSTHWTAFPDPAIPHVLRGWGETFGAGIDHHLDLGALLIRNVPTDIRAPGGRETRGNSIFIFEAAGLCIGHLGHLHHEPTEEQYAAIGRLDVVMAPVDGGVTLDLPTMVRVLRRIKARIIIPMHWFGDTTLETFVAAMQSDFAVRLSTEPEITVTLRSLPDKPTVVVLRPNYLRDDE